MSINRKVYSKGLQHICQISEDHGLIFINLMDFLVLLTTIFIKAAQNNICIIAICVMLNHFHIEAEITSEQAMSRFMNGMETSFARAYNKFYNLSGKLFQKPYKNAPKFTAAKQKENFIYIGNNPVAKKAVEHADDYRFNLLKYLVSDHPFSEPIDPLTISPDLVSLMKEVKSLHEKGKPLGYKLLKKRMYLLDKKEREQFIDFVIVTYNVINKEKVLKMFGSYENLIANLNLVAGNEYDIDDDVDDENYRHYNKMISISEEEGFDLKSMHFSRQTKLDGRVLKLKSRIMHEIHASEYEANKFLHLL